MLYVEISYQPDQNSRYKRRVKKNWFKTNTIEKGGDGCQHNLTGFIGVFKGIDSVS